MAGPPLGCVCRYFGGKGPCCGTNRVYAISMSVAHRNRKNTAQASPITALRMIVQNLPTSLHLAEIPCDGGRAAPRISGLMPVVWGTHAAFGLTLFRAGLLAARRRSYSFCKLSQNCAGSRK